MKKSPGNRRISEIMLPSGDAPDVLKPLRPGRSHSSVVETRRHCSNLQMRDGRGGGSSLLVVFLTGASERSELFARVVNVTILPENAVATPD